MSELLEAALRYGTLGLRVFPLAWYGHAEKVAGTPLVSKWPERATSDPEQIRRWWEANPEAGIGLACGDELGPNENALVRYLFVLDLDRHDPANDGIDAWLDLVEANDYPGFEGPRALTAGGGEHLYFTSPVPITNARGTLPSGIDVRGAGGYVVLPPSSHKSGGRHEWEIDAELGDVPLPEAPSWLLDILTSSPERSENSKSSAPAPKKTGGLLSGPDDRPGTEWADRTEWSELLVPRGWRFFGTGGSGEEQWTRPGKDPKDGPSATLNYGGADRLVVHSTNAPIPADSYSKLGFLAASDFGGDFSAAARSVAPEPSDRNSSATGRDTTEPELVAPATVDEWPDPEPISDVTKPLVFPLDVFPAWIRTQVEQAATEMQLDPDLPAMLALGALAAITGGRVRVSVAGSYGEPTNLYLVVALPPGSGKSPVFRMMLERPLGGFERELDEGGRKKRELDRLRRKAAEKELDRAINSGGDEEIRNAHAKLESLPEPTVPKLFVDDVTVEKLVMILAEQSGRLALVSAEGGLFDQMTGRYSESSKANLDPYLQGWAGDVIRVDRVNRDELRVYDPALTVALTVQPSVIERLADKPDLRGRGLTARFMFSYPLDRVGSRDFERATSYDEGIAAEYEARLLDLARTLREHYEDAPLRLRLSEDAEKLIRRMKADHEPRMRLGGDLWHMREWVTKAQSSTIRLAGLLYLADGGDAGIERSTGEVLDGFEIPASTVERALEVLRYWESHSRRVHELFSADSETKGANLLLDLIRERVKPGGEFKLTGRDGIARTLRNSDRGRPELLLSLAKKLVEAGWIAPRADEEDPYRTGTGKKATVFVLSPKAGECHGQSDTLGHSDDTRPGISTESDETNAHRSTSVTSVTSALDTESRGISPITETYTAPRASERDTRDTSDTPLEGTGNDTATATAPDQDREEVPGSWLL